MIRAILIFTILGGGMVAAFFSRFAALLLYLWFALFRPQEFVWYDISGLRISLVIGILLTVSCFLSGIFPNLTKPLSIGAAAYIIVSIIAQLGAINPEASWIWMDYLARLIFISLLSVSLLTTRKRFLLTVGVIAGSFAFHSAKAGLASFLGGGVRFSEGLAGSFMDNNGYALGIAMVLPLLIAVGQNLKGMLPFAGWMRRGVYLAAILSAIAIVSTFSREGFLALVVGILTFVVLQKHRFKMLAVVAVVVGLALIFVPIPKGYFDRIGTIVSYEEVQDESALSRLHFWHVACAIALDRPLGIGLRGFEQAYDKYDDLRGRYGTQRSVHNSHLEVLVGTGFLGFAIWAGMILYAFIAAFRIRKRSQNSHLPPEEQHFYYTFANGLIASMASFVVGGSFIALSMNDITWLTFSLITSLGLILTKSVPKLETVSSTAPVNPSFIVEEKMPTCAATSLLPQ
jgi:putative inorganic carbon (hco3(-)) transporter